tara:strand:+ start:362 stop:1078 length:717 start_codon:yes stop_codon:yes gene_type:complete
VSKRNLSDKKVDLYSLQEVMDYAFTNVQYLEKALTHPSQKQLSSEDTYERTEFLGDRVLGLIIAELLMKEFPEAAEGELAIRLSALVSGKTLCDVAEEIGLASYISVSDAERLAGTHKRNSVKADCLEAIIGAIYLDGGLLAAHKFIVAFWASRIITKPPYVPKTVLQEWAQARGLALPSYTVVNQSGPPHQPTFTVELHLTGWKTITASGGSKQLAERLAADAMLEHIANTNKQNEC